MSRELLQRLSVYCDELDDDPVAACALARKIGLSSICLRRFWSTNAGRATDEVCQKVMAAVRQNDLKVPILSSDCGSVPAHDLKFDDARRSIALAAYFKADALRVCAGLASGRQTDLSPWLKAVGGDCTSLGIVPLLEVTQDSYVQNVDQVASLLSAHTGWRLLYDPANLVMKKKQDPYERYWLRLRGSVFAVDLHDYKIGRGTVQAGVGDCRLRDTLIDALGSGHRARVVIEPGLIKKSLSKVDTVKAAIGFFIKAANDARK